MFEAIRAISGETASSEAKVRNEREREKREKQYMQQGPAFNGITKAAAAWARSDGWSLVDAGSN